LPVMSFIFLTRSFLSYREKEVLRLTLEACMLVIS
jgi:hypothetical protein